MITSTSKICITGAAGFIGSCMVSFLNQKGYTNLILIDDFSRIEKSSNYMNAICYKKIERNNIDDFLENENNIEAIIHFGARTDTTEMNYAIHEELNVIFSKKIWTFCTDKNIQLIYASSAATYGNGEFGYIDEHALSDKLVPLNPYGVSKNEFDKWALKQEKTPMNWYGLKFFNVYGPNEYHKKRMASIIFHAFNQIKNVGATTLFKSHNSNYEDGGQLRDFIYVKDILEITFWLLTNLPDSGIYNAGSGKANSFKTLASCLFKTLNKPELIHYIDTPIDIRDKYQYFTEATMQKLISVGYTKPLYTLEEGIKDYVTQYLNNEPLAYY
jgi:ADP-L-glycero-D-manno-heptose 6-epimerase